LNSISIKPRELAQAPECGLNRNHVFFSDGLTEKESKSGVTHFMVEVSPESNLKYEFLTASGQLILEKKLCPQDVYNDDEPIYFSEGIKVKTVKTEYYPYAYGFIPGRFNVDGSPIDIIVLGSNEKYIEQIDKNKRYIQKVKIIGGIALEECSKVPCGFFNRWKQDWKLVAVDLEDLEFSKINDIKNLASEDKKKIHNFFSNYKGRERKKGGPKIGRLYPKTRIKKFLNKKKALKFLREFPRISSAERKEEINICCDVFHGLEKQMPFKNSRPEIPVNYLKCLERVSFAGFQPHHPLFDAYLRFNAYIILKIKLKQKEATIGNSIEEMKIRKNKKKSYYRFIYQDAPDPGTENQVFEWVKTKKKDKSCEKGFQQHYDQEIGIFQGMD